MNVYIVRDRSASVLCFLKLRVNLAGYQVSVRYSWSWLSVVVCVRSYRYMHCWPVISTVTTL